MPPDGMMPDETEPTPEETAAEAVKDILRKHWCVPHDDEAKFLEDTLTREAEFHQALNMYGMYDQYRLSYNTYWGFSNNSEAGNQWQTQSIRAVGPNGELEYCVNEYRSFADQIVNMTTKNRPAWQTQSTNDDSSSSAQVEPADTLVKYYYEQVYGEKKEKIAVLREVNYGKCFTYIDWDLDAGDMVEVEEPVNDPEGVLPPDKQTIKREVQSGQVTFKLCYVWQVACDAFRSEADGHDYRIIQFPADRFEMVAKYPLYAEAIEQTGAAECAWVQMFPGYSNLSSTENTVTVRVVLHRPCKILPKGRKAVFVGEKLVEDGELPIDEIPLIVHMTAELDGTCFGISDVWNIIPAQQMNNAITSNIANNVDMFGRPPIAMYSAGEPTIDEMANGQKLIMLDSPESEPKVLAYPEINETPIKILNSNRGMMQSLTGLNGIARGESDAAVKSGAHAALYHAMAAESQSPRQTGLDLNREHTGNITFKFLRKFAKHPQMVAIAGENERPYLEKMDQEKVNSFQRVTVKTTSPMMRTTAGKLEIANILRQWPGMVIKDPAEIYELVTTGQMKPLYNSTRAETLRIKEENERLMRGPAVQEVPGEIDPVTGMPGAPTKTVPNVPVLFTDNVQRHAFGHLETLYANWDNPAIRDATMTHLLEHFTVARDVDPFTAMVLGIPSPQAALPPEQGGSGPTNATMQSLDKNANPAMKPTLENEDNAVDDSQGGSLPKPAKPKV